jgi:hypothetical protein
MSINKLMISGPGDAEPEKLGNEQSQNGNRRESAGHHGEPRSQRPALPSEADCLLAIARVAGLIAMGFLTPSQGNAVRAAFRDILQHYKGKAKDAQQPVSNADVMDVLRTDPKLLDLLAPLLTPDQLDMVMNAGDEGADE